VTTLVSSDTSTIYGEPITFTARVVARPPATGVPGGTVAFRDGSITLATVPLEDGVATFTTSTLRAGLPALKAVYSGDAEFTTSTGSVTQAVKTATTTATLGVSPNLSRIKRPVTLTAVVATSPPVPVAPAGTVRFYEIYGGDDYLLIGTSPLVGGVASVTTSALPPGHRRLVVRYVPASGFGTSRSVVVTVAIEGGTVTSVVASPSQSKIGQPVTLRSTVAATAPGGGTPAGIVTFKRGSVSLGSASLTDGVATFTTTLPSVGSHTITASYGGSQDFAPSRSIGIKAQVAKGATLTMLTSSATSRPRWQPVTFTAIVTTVAPAEGVPAGIVKFRDGATTIASVSLVNGRAAFTTSSLAVGTRTISAIYAGSSRNLTSTSPPLAQQITP
jgi:hypothetical protein